MCSEKEQAFLQDIIEAIHRIQSYVADIDYDTFQNDTKTQDATIRNLEIVGEATKQLSEEVRQQAEHIPWRNIARMRDKLIHHYFGVNLDFIAISTDASTRRPHRACRLPNSLYQKH